MRVGWIAGFSVVMAFMGAVSSAQAGEGGNPFAYTDEVRAEAAPVYNTMCITCHGKDGKGNTDAAAGFVVKPTDFSTGEFRHGETDKALFNTIKNGTENGMMAFDGILEDDQIWQLIVYIRGLKGGKSVAAAPEKEVLENPVAFSRGSVRRGKQLFARSCAICHGVDGKGDTQMREFLKTHPANLTDDQWTYGSRDGDIFDVIKNGRTERDMESFNGRISDERIWHIVNYIRYLGGKRGS